MRISSFFQRSVAKSEKERPTRIFSSAGSPEVPLHPKRVVASATKSRMLSTTRMLCFDMFSSLLFSFEIRNVNNEILALLRV